MDVAGAIYGSYHCCFSGDAADVHTDQGRHHQGPADLPSRSGSGFTIRHFWMYKFRSMEVQPEVRREESLDSEE